MYCGKCGKEIKEGEKFCTKCGTQISNDTEHINNVIQNKSKSSNSSKKKKIIIISIIIIFIVILGIIMNMILNDEKKNKENNTTENIADNIKKEDFRLDTTAETGITYNFNLNEVQQALDKACNENNVKKFTKFEYITSNDYNMVYNSYADENSTTACTIIIQMHNNYIASIAYHYTNENLKFAENTWKKIFYDTLKELFNSEYINPIIETLEKLPNNKSKYDNHTLCMKVKAENQGINQYSLTASSQEYVEDLKSVYPDIFNIENGKNKDNENKIENTSTTDENTNNMNSNNNTNYDNTDTNPNTNSKPKKEMIEMPYFQMGYELKEYTDKLDKLGIKYKIVKKSNLDYEDNTVIDVEANGKKIEKGTTITITVADNVYDLNVRFDTYYLLELADISATDYENKTINVKVDVHGKNVFNGNLPLTEVDWAETAFTIKGKPDIRNDFEITVEGKKITKPIKTYYFSPNQIGVCKEFRIGS